MFHQNHPPDPSAMIGLGIQLGAYFRQYWSQNHYLRALRTAV
ncbi:MULTISPECIES: hypothetical protein [unclassified Tolypothrix]|nr:MULTISPECIES: hypothetical protein [unclassified Tolypothrix]BAY95792.1 hypothetical protein NIES3275_78690 [Microchaete diplosiphon NIES-3275]